MKYENFFVGCTILFWDWILLTHMSNFISSRGLNPVSEGLSSKLWPSLARKSVAHLKI